MSEAAKQREFTRLFRLAEQDLYRYILILVPNRTDASDLLQETAGALWRRFDQYDPARPFGPWARKFAYMEVLKHRLYRSREHDRRVLFSKEIIETFSDEYTQHEEVLELRLAALAECLQKLTPEDRELVHQRYWDEENLRAVARERGVNEDRFYRRLQRIRQLLQQCIARTIAMQGGQP